MKVIPFFGALCAAAVLSAQPVLRLHGSTTVKGALENKQAEIEAEVGTKLEFQGVGSNAGLLTLAVERTDMAMIATPLEELAQRLNEKRPGSINPAEFRAEPIGAVRIAFIVNPHNPVRKLSAAQLADVLTGRVTNWREVGGPDLAILVVSLANPGPLVQDNLLRGAAFANTTRRLAMATQIPPVVAQETGAIGIISAAHVRGKTSLISTDAELLAPLFLVTRGEPDPVQRKLIEAARKYLRETS